MAWLWGSRNVWTPADMPPQDGKVVVVTGANCGIGFITALELAKRGAHVVLACLSALEGRQAALEIHSALAADGSPLAAKGKAECMLIDVSDPKSVRAFSSEFKRRFDRLDLLINNAGVSVPPNPMSKGGLEIHFATNYLGHFYLTSLLMDRLLKSKASRVVNISSMLHRFGWLFLDLATVATKKRGMDGYCISKLLNLLFTYELHRRLASRQVTNVKVVAAHPGICNTEMFNTYYRSHLPALLAALCIWLLSWLPLQTPKMGALPTLYAATAEDVASGDLYGPDGFLTARGYPVKEQSDAASHSLESAAGLWTLSETILDAKFDV